MSYTPNQADMYLHSPAKHTSLMTTEDYEKASTHASPSCASLVKNEPKAEVMVTTEEKQVKYDEVSKYLPSSVVNQIKQLSVSVCVKEEKHLPSTNIFEMLKHTRLSLDNSASLLNTKVDGVLISPPLFDDWIYGVPMTFSQISLRPLISSWAKRVPEKSLPIVSTDKNFFEYPRVRMDLKMGSWHIYKRRTAEKNGKEVDKIMLNINMSEAFTSDPLPGNSSILYQKVQAQNLLITTKSGEIGLLIHPLNSKFTASTFKVGFEFNKKKAFKKLHIIFPMEKKLMCQSGYADSVTFKGSECFRIYFYFFKQSDGSFFVCNSMRQPFIMPDPEGFKMWTVLKEKMKHQEDQEESDREATVEFRGQTL